MKMINLPKLKQGDKVAILSPSFAAPGVFPDVYELGLKRLKEDFNLVPEEFPTTKKVGASAKERANDLVAAFEDKEIKAVIASIGGDDQVSYISKLPSELFINNPKPFFGFSDNSHFSNFLFLNGIPSYYGGGLMNQFAMQSQMDEFTVEYIKHALFDEGEFELNAAEQFNDMGLDWADPSLINTRRTYWENSGWIWGGENNAEGLLWGGCLESVDEMLRNGVKIPSTEMFEDVILMLETSEELPAASYVRRVIRAFGERGILERINGVLVGRAKAWEFDKQNSLEQKDVYKKEQQEVMLNTIREYNQTIPVVQNMDFGHTDPQIPMPYGGRVRVDSKGQKIYATF